MGLPEPQAKASLRFSLGRFTTEEEVHLALDTLRETVLRLRAAS
jgi:cysteine desulfurase